MHTHMCVFVCVCTHRLLICSCGLNTLRIQHRLLNLEPRTVWKKSGRQSNKSALSHSHPPLVLKTAWSGQYYFNGIGETALRNTVNTSSRGFISPRQLPTTRRSSSDPRSPFLHRNRAGSGSPVGNPRTAFGKSSCSARSGAEDNGRRREKAGAFHEQELKQSAAIRQYGLGGEKRNPANVWMRLWANRIQSILHECFISLKKKLNLHSNPCRLSECCLIETIYFYTTTCLHNFSDKAWHKNTSCKRSRLAVSNTWGWLFPNSGQISATPRHDAQSGKIYSKTNKQTKKSGRWTNSQSERRMRKNKFLNTFRNVALILLLQTPTRSHKPRFSKFKTAALYVYDWKTSTPPSHHVPWWFLWQIPNKSQQILQVSVRQQTRHQGDERRPWL